MRIDRLYLNGFGIHRDRLFEIDGQAPATLFIGRNEAGKSTVLGFVRAMLFGFPTRARMMERYEPLLGGNHGGFMTLSDDQGRKLRLERYERSGSLKLIAEDGSEGGEAALRTLLGGLTPELFRNVFAFSLSELQRLDTLQTDEVNGFLFSSGMGLSGNAIVHAERKLALALEQLYKPKGTKQELNLRLKEIEAGEAALRSSKERSGKLNAWQADLRELDNRIAGLERELDAARADGDWYNKCSQARGSWVRMLEIERDLAELERLGMENGIEEHAQSRSDEWVRLIDAAEAYHENRMQAVELAKELESDQAAFQRYVRQIDSAWTLEQVRKFPVSVQHREQISVFGERLAALQTRKATMAAQHERLRADRESLLTKNEADKAAYAEIVNVWENVVPPEAARDLDGFEAAIRRSWETLRQVVSELTYANKRLDDIQRSELALRGKDGSNTRQQKQKRNRGRAWDNRKVMLVCILAAGFTASGLVWMYAEQPLPAIILLLGTVMVGSLLYFGLPAQSKDSAELNVYLQDLALRRTAAVQETEALKHRLAESGSRMAAPFSKLGKDTEAAAAAEMGRNEGMDPVNTLRQLETAMEALLKETGNWRQLALDMEQARQRVKQSAAALEDWHAEWTKQQESDQRLAAEEEAVKNEWSLWLQARELSPVLMPDTVKLMGQYAEHAMLAAERSAKLEAKIALLEARIREYEEQVAETILKAGFTVPASLTEQIYLLKHLHEKQLAYTRIRDQRGELQKEKRHLEAAVLAWVSQEHAGRLYDELARLDADQLGRKQAEARTRSNKIEQELDEFRDRRGRLRGEIERLFQGDEHSLLLQSQQEKVAGFEQSASAYIQLALSAQLIRKAREVYEKERQPGVLRQASRYFERISEGRYVRVVSKLGDKTIFVEKENGELVDSSYLSRGTAEQLYLAMRFALADEFSKTVAMPLFMDDIFVNFDPYRLKSTLSVLSDVSQNRQLLMFTCHGHVAAAVQEALPSAQLLAL